MTARERKHCENGKMLLLLQELKKYFLSLLGLRQVVKKMRRPAFACVVMVSYLFN